MTLEKLLQDGRIHPARIEETYYQAKSELESHMVEAGEEAVFEADVQGLDPELVKILGRLKFRTSYGQNVLAHSVECAHLAALMAAELGASAEDRPPRGAAARHRQGGLARGRGPARAGRRRPRPPPRRGRGGRARDGGPSQRGRAADRRGGDRPGRRRAVAAPARARAASRWSSTSSACATSRSSRTRHDGVDKVYAMQAGREIRVIVEPGRDQRRRGDRARRTRSRARSSRSSSTPARSR